jgi:hypothetical protein
LAHELSKLLMDWRPSWRVAIPRPHLADASQAAFVADANGDSDRRSRALYSF